MNFGVNSTGNLFFYHYNGGQISFTGSSAISLSTWTHVAVVVSGGTATLYVNGVSVGSGTWYGIDAAGQNSTSYFGLTPDVDSRAWLGYISNLRVSSNARSISVPVAPYANDATTDFLTCQSPTVIDNSDNDFAITVNGDARPTKYNPFGETVTTGVEYSPASHGGSVYFDGTGDYLAVSNFGHVGAGDYTIECWVYLPLTSFRYIFDIRPAGQALGAFINSNTLYIHNASSLDQIVSTNFVLNTWNHFAYVRSGSGSNNTSIYLNGNLINQRTDTTNFSTSATLYIGADNAGNYSNGGYVSNFRIVKGTAVYTSAFVPPAAPPSPVAGTTLLVNGTNAAIQDKTGRNVLETVGNARVVNGVKKYGTGSLAFDGTGDWLAMPTTSELQMDTGDFTWEAWVYIRSLPTPGNFETLWCQRAASSGFGGPAIVMDSSGNYFLFIANAASNNWQISNHDTGRDVSLNTWQHLALVRNGSSINLYQDGVAGTSTTISQAVGTSGATSIGAGAADGSQAIDGYIDDLRITKGVARYTANFTPPTSTYKLK
jgi:hypothetical protein